MCVFLLCKLHCARVCLLDVQLIFKLQHIQSVYVYQSTVRSTSSSRFPIVSCFSFHLPASVVRRSVIDSSQQVLFWTIQTTSTTFLLSYKTVSRSEVDEGGGCIFVSASSGLQPVRVFIKFQFVRMNLKRRSYITQPKTMKKFDWNCSFLSEQQFLMSLQLHKHLNDVNREKQRILSGRDFMTDFMKHKKDTLENWKTTHDCDICCQVKFLCVCVCWIQVKDRWRRWRRWGRETGGVEAGVRAAEIKPKVLRNECLMLWNVCHI